MDILERIVADKRKEVALKKELIPLSQLEKSVLFRRETISLSERLKKSRSGIIAEYKRRSPSKQVINHSLNCFDVAKIYEKAGACGMSVLTDGKYFGGSLDDLLVARASCNLPLLRKEFVVDTYQIFEAKAYGADAILLIVSVLTREEILAFTSVAKQLGLEVLLEVHSLEELELGLVAGVDMVGVNNRNLKTFEVSIQNSKNLSSFIPDEFVRVSESGISETKTIKELQNYGYKGFLIGENFMKSEDIAIETRAFIEKIEE